MISSRLQHVLHSLFLGLLTATICIYSARAQEEDYVLRWASSGGGWRSMSANIGYANAFAKAGLIDATTQTSKFSAISSTSGGSWFSLQFFYSPQFFQRTLTKNTENLNNFVQRWMRSYKQWQLDLDKSTLCQSVSLFGMIPGLSGVSDTCNTLSAVNFDWVQFVDGMLRTASQNYGDEGLMDRTAGSNNRVVAMANTDLLIQTTLAPTSIYKDESQKWFHSSTQERMNLIGPSGKEEEEEQNGSPPFAVGIPVQYAVKSDSTEFVLAVEDDKLPLQVQTQDAPRKIRWKDWEYIHLYPGTEGQDGVLVDEEGLDVDGEEPLEFNTDFFGGGEAPIAQVMAASSATFARFSGYIPSFLVHRYSIDRHENSQTFWDRLTKLPGINLQVNALYSSVTPTAETAVCSQWPNDCGSADGRLIDGGFSDGPSLAMNIGQYQTKDSGDLSKRIKVIVTNNNYYEDTNIKFLSYFAAPFNEGIAPGDAVWPPSTEPGLSAQQNPWRSMQIFQDAMDDETLVAAWEEIPGANLTTAVYPGLMTTENPAFGIQAGQTVDVLLLQINSIIPTQILAPADIDTWGPQLGDMVQQIADSEELVARIQSFLAL